MIQIQSVRSFARRFCLGMLFLGMISAQGAFAQSGITALALPDTIDWCNLQWPAQTSAAMGTPTEYIFGRIFIDAVTTLPGAPPGVVAEVGWGAANTAPSTWVEWTPATYNASHTGDNNDEFMAQLTLTTPGVYSYAYRYSRNGGAYVYGDLGNGSTDGVQLDQLGALTITIAPATTAAPSPTTSATLVPTSVLPTEIGWCNLQYPSQTTAFMGIPSENIYGQIYIENVTALPGAPPGVSAELGWGARSTSPTLWAEWIPATYNSAHTGDNNDEFQAQLTFTTPGEYSFAYRYSRNGGPFVYGDLGNGSSDGIQLNQLGQITVTAATMTATPAATTSATLAPTSALPTLINWGGVQYPAQTTAAMGSPTEIIYGQVYIEGVTSLPGPAVGVNAELGWGGANSDPSTWAEWTPAVFNAGHTGNDNDEYMAQLTLTTPGEYRYAYRFSRNGGPYVYGDLGNGSSDGTQLDQLGVLTITIPVSPTASPVFSETPSPSPTGILPTEIGWCNLQYPSQTTAYTEIPSEFIYGQIYIENVTALPGAPPGVNAELGWGARNTSPTLWAEWTPATYNAAHTGDNNDEFQAQLTFTTPGEYSFAYRYSRNGGPFVYGDLGNGSSDGIQLNQLGQLTVTPPPTTTLTPSPSPTGVLPTEIGWCNLQFPSQTTAFKDVPSENIYGQIYIENVTALPGAPPGVNAELGWGARNTSPTLWAEWTPATFNSAHTGDNNDEFQAQLTFTTPGEYSFAYRYSRNGGPFVYGDLGNGSSDGIQLDQLGQIAVTVGPTITATASPSPTSVLPTEIGWCNLQYPEQTTAAMGSATEYIFGQIFIDGVTPLPGPAPGVQAEVGWGALNTDPSTWVEWTRAIYNTGSTGNNDEYMAQLTLTTPGVYSYAYRYSRNGGPYKYGDIGGSDDGVQLDKLGKLTITIPPTSTPGPTTTPSPLRDTDGDGFADSYEIQNGSNPLEANSVPANLDFNGDGKVDVKDAAILYRNRIGKIPVLPLQ